MGLVALLRVGWIFHAIGRLKRGIVDYLVGEGCFLMRKAPVRPDKRKFSEVGLNVVAYRSERKVRLERTADVSP